MMSAGIAAAVPHPDDASLLRELRRLLQLTRERNDEEEFHKAIGLCDAAEHVMRNNKYCGNPPALQKLQAGLFFARAIAHVRCGHHALATEDLSRVIAIDAEYDMAHAYRAGELSDLGLHTLAVADYTTAIRLNSQDPANYFNRAQCYLRLDSPQRASRDLTVYIAFEHYDPEAFLVRAEAYAAQGKWRKAQHDLQQCLQTIDYTAWVLDQGARGTAESSLAKLACSEALYRVADRCVQILGGLGITGDTPVQQIFREIRAFRIYDGPSEVHRWSIAKRIADDRAKRA